VAAARMEVLERSDEPSGHREGGRKLPSKCGELFGDELFAVST